MPHQEVIELVSESFRLPVLLPLYQEMPNDVLLLRQRFLLPIAKIELGYQIHGQADQAQACKALQRQPPRQPLAQRAMVDQCLHPLRSSMM